MSVETYEWDASVDEKPCRLDRWLVAHAHDLSRSRIQALIDDGSITVNGEVRQASYLVRPGDHVRLVSSPPAPLELEPEAIPLTILYEDQDLIVIDKPRDLVVHPAAGNWSGTLVNALLSHCDDLGGINGTLRPGIVHRLDKDTSGVMMVAKNDLAQANLSEQIKDRLVKRQYVALVHGDLAQDRGVIDAPIGRHPVQRKKMAVVANGKPAVTHYHVRERFGDFTLAQLQLKTGRTHQIRVHMAFIGHPVAGDPVYGPRKSALGLTAQALHAELLGFTHPRTGAWLEFSASPPQDFLDVLAELRKRQDRE
ncbi:MAG: RluA family pseudouridine synthase [Bacillota bacterium]